MQKVQAVIQQLAVGQGGLCHGQLIASPQTLNWIFDCGSNQTGALAAEIDRLPNHIDLLFISHLDDDHVSGIDRLLAQRSVGEIILPYLSDETRLMMVASASARARLTGTLLDLLSDPVAWFDERGAKRVTFIDGADENGGAGEVFRRPVEPDLREIRTLTTKWTKAPQRRRSTGNARRVPADAALQVVGSDEIGKGSWALDYVFVPHAHPPRRALVKAFAAELAKQFRGRTTEQIVQAARTSKGRERLHRCYDSIWSDHNLVSMSLYTGPTGNGASWESYDHLPPHWSQTRKAAGWISTGDASFASMTRRRSFGRRYDAFAREVGVFVVPHHGAATSWNPAAIYPFVNLHTGLATAGPNGYGHPHPLVISDFARAGVRFHQVSEDPRTLYRLVSRVS